MCAANIAALAFKSNAAFTSAAFAFKSNAAFVAVDMGLSRSAVLSTFAKPKLARAPTAVVAPVPPPAIPKVLPNFPAVSAKRA
jgi:hypothetical protein